jgi:ketosteroid isomerase-like protein
MRSDALVDDEHAITRTLYEYADRVDRLDVDGVLACFTPDAEFDFGFGRVFAGTDGLRRLYERLDMYRATSHHVTNVCIDVAGDTARVRSVLYALHIRHDGTEVHAWGQYADEFARLDGRWLIRRRAFRASAEKGTEPDQGRETLYEFLPRA